MIYNYLDAVKEDCKEAIKEIFANNREEFTNREDLESYLNDELWADDSVTGNSSGSYTFNRWKAHNYLRNNNALLKEALKEFCTPAEEITDHFLNEDWEYFDVAIRCYLLNQAISDALDELEEEKFIYYTEDITEK